MKVAVLDDYPGVAADLADWSALGPDADLHVFRDTLSDEDAIARRLRDFDVLVGTRERTPFPASLLDKLPNLKLFVTIGVSNPSFDVQRATELGIALACTGGSGRDATELTWALILAMARNIPRADRATRRGRWQTSIGRRLAGKTLGVIGLGKVGSQVALIGQAFHMRVTAWSQNLTAERAREYGAALVTKEELLGQSDVTTLHMRLSARTIGVIGARELAAMKPTAFIVNTSRSRLVDEAALVEALSKGAIGGAALDVFDQEPIPPDHPLLKLENTIVTPRIAGMTVERYRAAYAEAIEDILAYRNAKPLRILNPEVLASPTLRQLS